jgi:mannose-1-phosphate guanylyltransferase
MRQRQRWAIVLAAGAGSRLRTLTTDERGSTPKQFCSLSGGESLLELSLARAERLVPRSRVLVIVAAEHETHWRAQLRHLPRGNVIVQPRNRGTAPGLVLPLLTVCSRDPDPTVVVLPSDHYVHDEVELGRALLRACHGVESGSASIVPLGIAAEYPATDYGWITPGRGVGPFKPVEAFVEKPSWSGAAARSWH